MKSNNDIYIINLFNTIYITTFYINIMLLKRANKMDVYWDLSKFNRLTKNEPERLILKRLKEKPK